MIKDLNDVYCMYFSGGFLCVIWFMTEIYKQQQCAQSVFKLFWCRYIHNYSISPCIMLKVSIYYAFYRQFETLIFDFIRFHLKSLDLKVEEFSLPAGQRVI